MLNQINLISSQQRQFVRTKRLVWFSILAAGITLVVSTAAAAGLYSYHLLSRRRLAIEDDQITSLRNQIAESAPIEQRQLLLRDRLTAAAKILEVIPNIRDKLGRLMELLPSQIAVDHIDLQADSNRISLEVTSASFAGVAQLLNTLENGGFSAVEFTGISRSKNGNYQFIININQ